MTIQEAVSKRISFANILFATDFSVHSNVALPFVLSMAREHGAHIFAVHVIPPPPLGNFPTVEIQALSAQAIRESKESMHRFEPQLHGVPHETILRKGEIWHELAEVAREKSADLIVVGTHGRAGASKLLIGSVAEKIFRQAVCPVLTVGPNVAAEPRSVAEIHSILCPVDFTEASLAAFPYALSLAQEHKARLYLLHVSPEPMERADEAAIAAQMKALVPSDANLWCEPKATVETGNPADKILEMAEEIGVDLIVLGIRPVSHFAGARTHLAMATAYAVVSRALCPVLSVRG